MQKKTGKQPIVFLIFYNIRFIHCSMLQHKITILSPSDHSKNNKHQNIDSYQRDRHYFFWSLFHSF